MRVSLFLLAMVWATITWAGQQTFLLQECLNRSYADELVTYPVNFPAGTRVDSLCLTDADAGQAIPFQLSRPVTKGGGLASAEVSFWVDTLPVGGQRRYTLTYGAGSKTPAFAPLGVTQTDLNAATVEIGNGVIGLRLWGGSQTFDPPTTAGLPGILQGYWGADRTWRGGGETVTDVPLKSHTLTISEDGPLWRAYVERLVFADGGVYAMRIVVYPGKDFVRIDELGKNNFAYKDSNTRANCQCLHLTELAPDQYLSYTTFSGNIASTPLNMVSPSAYVTAIPGACWNTGGWGGVYAADPAKTDVLGTVPIRSGTWRGAARLLAFNTDRTYKAELRYSMAVQERHSLLVITSKAKAVLSQAQIDATRSLSPYINWGSANHYANMGGANRPTPDACYLWKLRNTWGDFPLDKVKDWVLDYDATKYPHPRILYGMPDDIKETFAVARKRLLEDPSYKVQNVSYTSPQSGMQALEYIKYGTVADLFRKDLKIRQDWDMADATGIVQEQMILGHTGAMYVLAAGQALRESVMWADVLWDVLPPAERARWCRYALALSYILRDEDNWGAPTYTPGQLAPWGNFNSCRWVGLGLASVFFEGHPAAAEWRNFAKSQMDGETTATISRDGVYPECLSNYYPFWWQNVTLFSYALQRHGWGDYRANAQYQAAARFFIDVLTPPDATFDGHRMVPPIGHHPGAGYRNYGQYALMARLFGQETELGKLCQWAWNENGRPAGHHYALPVNLFLADATSPTLPRTLTSKAWDDYGFLFRNHVNTGKETYFLLKNSRVEWHQEADEGSFHFYGKGALLAADGLNLYSQDKPCPYCDPAKTDAADRLSGRTARHHNLITFRGPVNDGMIRGQWRAFRSTEVADYGWANIPKVSTSPDGRTWEDSYDRRALLLKATNPDGPEYIVLQDTTRGPDMPEWNLDVHSPLPTLAPEGKAGWATFPGFGVAMDAIFVAPAGLDLWAEKGMIESAYQGTWHVKEHALVHASPTRWSGGVDKRIPTSMQTTPYGCALSDDLRYLALGGNVRYGADGKATQTEYLVKLLDRNTGAVVGTYAAGNDIMFSAGLSPDNKIVAGGNRGHLYLWDVAGGTLLHTLAAPWTMQIAFSTDGTLVAAADYNDGKARVWNVATGALLQTLDPQSGKLNGVAFSADGARLATAGDRGVAIFDVASGKPLIGFGTGQGWEDGASTVSFSPDGSMLAVGGVPSPKWDEAKVTVWDATVPKDAATPLNRTTYRWRSTKVHGNYVTNVRFSPDGTKLVSAGRESKAYLWDAASGTLLRELPGQLGSIRAARWSADGSEVWLVTPFDKDLRVTAYTGGDVVTRFLTVLYPRDPKQAPPTVTSIADGKGLRLTHAEGTDVVLMSDTPFTYTGDGITFTGTVAALREMRGETWMTLVEGSKLSWRGKTLTAPGVVKY
jgi:WD40 repeat protein